MDSCQPTGNSASALNQRWMVDQRPISGQQALGWDPFVPNSRWHASGRAVVAPKGHAMPNAVGNWTKMTRLHTQSQPTGAPLPRVFVWPAWADKLC